MSVMVAKGGADCTKDHRKGHFNVTRTQKGNKGENFMKEPNEGTHTGIADVTTEVTAKRGLGTGGGEREGGNGVEAASMRKTMGGVVDTGDEGDGNGDGDKDRHKKMASMEMR